MAAKNDRVRTESGVVAGAERELARKVARELCASCLAWAKTFGACISRHEPELEELWFREILAFGLYLLETRREDGRRRKEVQGFEGADNTVEVWKAIKAACAEYIQRKRLGRFRRWVALSSSSTRERAAAASHRFVGGDGDRSISRETFERFCANTGLSSRVLVGEGKNLAALLFYVAVHQVASGEQRLQRSQARLLLEAARKCRMQLEQCVSNGLKRKAEGKLDGPARIPWPRV